MIPGLWELTDYAVNQIAKKNVTVIWSYQNAPRIGKPYITLDYTTDDIPNFDWFDDQNITVDGYRSQYSWRMATVDMQFYCGQDSMKLANLVAMSFASETVLYKQGELNVAIGNRLFLQRVPAMINLSQYEERAIYQFNYLYTEEYTDWTSWIGTVEINGPMCQETISIEETHVEPVK